MLSNSSILNTCFLFFRIGIVVLLSFVTVRLLVKAFEIELYSLYIVCTSVVAFAVFLQWAITSTSQRFFNVELVTSDYPTLNVLATNIIGLTFCICFVTYFLIWILEPIIVPFVVREDWQIELARTLYMNAALVFCLLLINSVFVGHCIAVGNIRFYVLVSVADALLKVSAAYILDESDRYAPIVYSEYLILISMLQTVILIVFCLTKHNYLIPVFSSFSIKKIKDLCNFAGWTLFGQMTLAFRVQGLIQLFNLYIGGGAVAARSIANQVADGTLMFSQNFSVVMAPQLTHAYVKSSKMELLRQAIFSSYICFSITWALMVPIILTTDDILRFWLTVPIPLASDFIRLALIETVIHSMTLPLVHIVQATGDVRRYWIIIGLLQITIIPISLMALVWTSSPHLVYLLAIFVSIIMTLYRIKLVAEIMVVSSCKLTFYILAPAILTILINAIIISLLLMFDFNYIFVVTVFLALLLCASVSIVILLIVRKILRNLSF